MQKIKILHVIKSLGRGGAEMLLPETLKLHNTEKYEFHYIYFLPWKDQMVNAIIEAGGIVNCFKAKDNIQIFFQYQKIINYCKDKRIDLIHCHLPWAGFVGRAVYKQIGIPVIYTEHNMQERYHKITKAINKLTFNSQSLALGVSQDVTNSIRNNINPKIPVKTLFNGVNTAFFQRSGHSEIRKELGIPREGIIIGNVAVFRFQKRLVEWLKVIKTLRQSNKNIYGIIVGAGPLEDEIKKEWKDLNLQESVFFPGLKTDVKPYFDAMDIFMMSSSFEGLPIALLEAMSMECAVVSTDAGGIKEVIRNGIDGLTCPADDWQELSTKVRILADEPEKLSQFKKASRKRVQEAFSMERMVTELEASYIEVLNNSSFPKLRTNELTN